MQDAAAFVARFFAQMAESTVGFIDENQGIRICHNVHHHRDDSRA